jgi:formylglycine-generating enzyme required for sulfatase activity
MSVLDDPSLDERARPILDAAPFPPPTDEALQGAMLLDDTPSPAMLEGFASWLDRITELERAGFGPEELLRVALRGLRGVFAMRAPPAAIFGRLFAIPGGEALGRALCDELSALDVNGLPYPVRAAAQTALVRLAAADALDARHLPLFDWEGALEVLPAIAAALPPAKREAFVIAHANCDDSTAAWVLEALLATRAAVDTPALAAIREAHLAAARAEAARIEDTSDRAEREERLAELAAAHAAPPSPPAARPTEHALRSLAYLEGQRAAKRREASLGPLAEEAWGSRAIPVDAPELATMAAWMGAGGARRRQVAEDVAAAVGGALDGLRAFGAHTIAVVMVRGLPFCLVPGGAVEMGLSPEEEAAVRAAAAAKAGCGNHYELYESLLEQAASLRPLTRVHVGPLLAQQEPRHPLPPAELTALLEREPFRLPSEAEWEHLARGGVAREPTYVGPEVPDDEGWLPSVGRAGVTRANAFGLWGFGFEPEVCADAWHPSHEGVARDGSPRRGAGPRVVRGGAGQLYPFQATGEWHLLLSAMRTHQGAWEFAQSARLVIGVRPR